MTWLSSEAVAGWYAVLEYPRGPRMGRVRRNGSRYWIAECGSCDGPVGDGRTRPAAGEALAFHYRRSHLRKPVAP